MLDSKAVSHAEWLKARPELLAAEKDILGKAAFLSGIRGRLRDYATDAKLRALQDCVLFLQV
jgi:predicted dithiol-disulfide oxidoreductase (DUF899 family)